MIVHVLNKELEVIGLIEDYYSLTWAERYSVCGDFELELPISYDGSELVEFGNFLYIESSDTIMIIEDIKPMTGMDATSLMVQGESAESLLKRRVIKEPTTYNTNPESLIYALVEVHLTTPAYDEPERKINILSIRYLPLQGIVGLYREQVDVQTIYKIVTAVCKDFDIGFKIRKEDDMLRFSVYKGLDRSYDQSTNPFVIFSDDFDNVIASSFYLSQKGMVNTIRIVTEDTFTDPHSHFYWSSGAEPTDLDRFEAVLETEVDKDLPDGDPLLDAEMLTILWTRGDALIKENKPVGLFEGDFHIHGNFKYGVDFFMGDVVQCLLEGRNIKARIIELVRSYSTEGETSYIAMDFITT